MSATNGMSYWRQFKKNYEAWKQIFSYANDSVKAWRRIPSETYVKYPPNSNFGGKKVLNIGCGRCVYKGPNIINTDLQEGPGVDMTLDLSKAPFPFEDNSFDFIIANHVLEHVPNWWECFKELARVVKPGGKIEVWIPPLSSDSSFTYRDHINRIGTFSFAGINGCSGRNLTNLTAMKEFDEMKHVRQLQLTSFMQRPILRWWVWFAPEDVLIWMAEHLRNIISEEGYVFTKKEG